MACGEEEDFGEVVDIDCGILMENTQLVEALVIDHSAREEFADEH